MARKGENVRKRKVLRKKMFFVVNETFCFIHSFLFIFTPSCGIIIKNDRVLRKQHQIRNLK